jgi:quercetin dioxygenase-like cupin family protein
VIISNLKDIQGTEIHSPEIKNAVKKVLISPENGWDGYYMRVFELGKDGYTPKHTHPWPHINYIISGKGQCHLDGTDYDVEAGGFAYVPGGKLHQFRNTSEETFTFICIVPEEGEK